MARNTETIQTVLTRGVGSRLVANPIFQPLVGPQPPEKSVPPARFERTAPGLGILCSIHLSYGGSKRFQLLSSGHLSRKLSLLPFCYQTPRVYAPCSVRLLSAA